VSILGTRVLRGPKIQASVHGSRLHRGTSRTSGWPAACYVHFRPLAVAHAKIRGIDTSAAKDAEGRRAVYTGRRPHGGRAQPRSSRWRRS